MARHENTSRNTHDVAFTLLTQDPGCRRVLDLPCGSGLFASRCAAAGLETWGGDFTPPAELPSVTLARCDMNQPLPFTDGQFDAIACIDGIEHLERPFDFVRECRRALRSGGSLVLSTPNISAMRSRLRWLLTGFHNKCKVPLDETRPHPLHHIAMISYPELRYLLHSNGFTLVSVATNRIKPISLLSAPWWPLSWLATTLAMHREERDPAQRGRNRDIRRALFSAPVYYGETLIVRAVRI